MRRAFRMTNRRRKALFGFAFVSPWIAGFLLFTMYPMAYSAFLSFQDVKITPTGVKTHFVGWDNYKYAFFNDPTLLAKFLAYLREMALNVPVIVVFALIIALLINQKIRFRGAFRTVFFLPVIITSGPVINELLGQGATTIPNIEQYGMFAMIEDTLSPAIADPVLYLFRQIILVLWFSGVQILVFLAGLQKVDRALYEAARIDGASAWESFWKVTLPVLKPLVLVNVIYTVVYLSTFALNEVIVTIRNNMFSTFTGFGYATAIAWLYFLLICVVLIIWTALIGRQKN
jgi:ABC-type sugar transport systems, permease components